MWLSCGLWICLRFAVCEFPNFGGDLRLRRVFFLFSSYAFEEKNVTFMNLVVVVVFSQSVSTLQIQSKAGPLKKGRIRFTVLDDIHLLKEIAAHERPLNHSSKVLQKIGGKGKGVREVAVWSESRRGCKRAQNPSCATSYERPRHITEEISPTI